ncbi:MAG TPA: antibiotic biosynthesis monooxygenase [Alphaproteobacteria bacterium]|nr:antibiotic biosynthesis monooxygenase [Alphaproteobacteria bacterium]
MIVTVFRSRLRPGNIDEYAKMAEAMSAAAMKMPGYISHKGFTAPDGERVTIVEFESIETHQAWAEHADHRTAQRLGRERFYSEYSIQICEVLRANKFG